MLEKNVVKIGGDRNQRDHSEDSKRVSWNCRIGAPMIAIALFLPELEAVAKSLDELAHRPNETELSHRSGREAALQLKIH
jgi:hypothetical protein